jgi:hypothetical protein
MTYLADLEVVWQQNIKKRPKPDKRTRSKALRGGDFFQELLNCHALTGDQRFLDAAEALHENGIIDVKFNFTRWQPPMLRKAKRNLELLKLNWIHQKIRRRVSLSRACAELAAKTGHRANSFTAAIKDLEKSYRREASNLELPKEDEEGLRLEVDKFRQKKKAGSQAAKEMMRRLLVRTEKQIYKDVAVEARKVLELLEKLPIEERKLAYEEIAPELRELRKVLGAKELEKILGKLIVEQCRNLIS